MRPTVPLVLGMQNTATSTVVKIANAHPSAFLLFEVDFGADPQQSRHHEALVQRFPWAAGQFRRGATVPGLDAFAHHLVAHGHAFEVIGTKIPGFRPDLLVEAKRRPVVFCFRDPRTWTCKNLVVRRYLGDLADVRPAVVRTVRYLAMSFRRPVTRLAMEQLIADPDRYRTRLAHALGLEPGPMAEWWDKRPGPDDPRAFSPWENWHASARVKPARNDTASVLADHPFWDALLPLFDHLAAHAEAGLPAAELDDIDRDLAALASGPAVPLEALFEGFVSERLVLGTDRDFVERARLRLDYGETPVEV